MPDVGFTVSKISGTDGSVRMPDVGVLVGWFSTWSLSKRKPTDATYVLKATFGHVNATLWAQNYPKEYIVKLSKDRIYTLCQPDGGAINFNPDTKQLEMENVQICPQSDES